MTFKIWPRISKVQALGRVLALIIGAALFDMWYGSNVG